MKFVIVNKISLTNIEILRMTFFLLN